MCHQIGRSSWMSEQAIPRTAHTKSAGSDHSSPQNVAEAAWLYYGEGKTQQEVARALGVSRASVANYLAEARRCGLVEIALAPDLLSCSTLARDLADRHGLTGAHVIPELADDGTEATGLRTRIGRAGAAVLANIIRPGMVVGVAWGRTMLALAQALQPCRIPGLKVVQVSGSSLGDTETSPEACTAVMANRLGGLSANFHAPGVVSSAALCESILAEPGIARHMDRARNSDLAVFGVGEVAPGVGFDDPHFLTGEVLDAYHRAGAVAFLLGRFIDQKGVELEGPLAGRQISMALDDLRHVPIRICVAGGAAKAEAIAAMLAGRYATHLITDAALATRLQEIA